jgi:hypothetical protein
MENLVIAGLFIVSLVYVGNLFKKQFSKEHGSCASNCTNKSCNAKIEIPTQKGV